MPRWPTRHHRSLRIARVAMQRRVTISADTFAMMGQTEGFDLMPSMFRWPQVIDVRYEATGSLLPQPFLSTPRGGSWASKVGPPGEASYSLSTIRRVHALVLQSTLDLSFGAALERVVTAAKAITHSRHAQIFFLEKNPVQPGGLCGSASFSLRLKGRGTQDKVLPNQGLAGVCAAENLPVISNRPHHDARFDPDIDWAPGSGAKTVACAPMTSLSGKVVGVIQVCNKVHAGYVDEDMHFLDMLARQAAVTFDMCIKNDQRQMQAKTANILKGLPCERTQCASLPFCACHELLLNSPDSQKHVYAQGLRQAGGQGDAC